MTELLLLCSETLFKKWITGKDEDRTFLVQQTIWLSKRTTRSTIHDGCDDGNDDYDDKCVKCKRNRSAMPVSECVDKVLDVIYPTPMGGGFTLLLLHDKFNIIILIYVLFASCIFSAHCISLCNFIEEHTHKKLLMFIVNIRTRKKTISK